MRNPEGGLRLAALIGLLAAVGAAPFAYPQQLPSQRSAPSFPSLIEDESRPDLPRWIAADLLVDVFGKLRREYIPAEIARFLRGKEDLIDEINDLGAVADSRSIPCVVSYAIVGDGYMSNAASSLYELMMDATFAVSGVVEGSVGGFWRGSPATVITVSVTEIFKSRPEGEVPVYINATIGFVGDFAIGSARFCTKSNQWSQAPKPGDEVFLFPKKDLQVMENLLMIDGAGEEIIFVTSDELVVPGRLSTSLKLDATWRDPQLGSEALRQSLHALRR